MTRTDWFMAALCGLWTAAFIAQGVALPDWEPRVWAAFLQAVLSALAIFSAWWLQDQKRQVDRREARQDTVHTAAAVIRQIEWSLSGMLVFRRADRLHWGNVRAAYRVISRSDDILKSLNLAHFDDRERTAVLNIIDCVSQIIGFLDNRLRDPEEEPKLGQIYLALYADIYDERTRLLERWPLRPGEIRHAPKMLLLADDEPDMQKFGINTLIDAEPPEHD